MKIGIIYTAFNTEDYLSNSLSSWFDARSRKLGGHDFFIVAVSVPFEKFGQPAQDNTQEILSGFHIANLIDWVIKSDTPQKETEARGSAANHLLSLGCDILWQVDSDEFYTTDEISKIIKFVEKQPLIAAFPLCLKNFIFDEKHYLEEPFSPMRIHRVTYNSCSIAGFYDDNNIYYNNNGTKVRDIQLPTMKVPKLVAWIKHLTWLSDERSKKKIEYQVARGWECSFRWGENGLDFNDEYFKTRGILRPTVIST